MRLRWKTVVISCVALIFGSAIIWLVRAELIARQLAKDATACRVRAEHGDAESQFRLGSMYYHGKGVPKDYVEAVHWYRESAEHENAKAQYNLSYMYREGKGIPQDYPEAVRWCRKAAEQGDVKAQDGLGFMYYRGEGVAQDYAEAVRWYRKSAEQGYADAQYDLGYMYYYGYGVSKDQVEANRLFHEAAAQGNERAERAIRSKKVYVPAITKITLFLKFSASLLFLIIFLRHRPSRRTREQKLTGLTALLLMSSVVLDLYWYFYIGLLRASPTITAFYTTRHLLGGGLIAMLLYLGVPKSAKVVLIASAVLFIAFNVIGLVRYELRHIPLATRLLCLGNGLFIGMSIPSAIFLWLESKRTGEGLNGKGGPEYPSRRSDG